MARTADGKPLGNALHNAEENRFENLDKVHFFTPFLCVFAIPMIPRLPV